MPNMRAGESWTGAPVRRRRRLITGTLNWCILMRNDGMNSWRLLCRRHIDLLDTTTTDRGRDNDAIERRLALPVLISIGRSAGDFCRTVQPADGLSDHGGLPTLICAASANVRQSVRFASSILKSLWPHPTALLIAASAAV